MLTSCGAGMFSSVLDTVDDIETDEVVEVKVYRDALKRDTDLKISIDLKNQKDGEPSH